MINEGAKKELISGRFDYITPFYNQKHSNKGFVEDIDKLLGSYDLNVKSIPFTSDRLPTEWFPKISTKSRKIKVLKKYDGLQLFQMTYSYRDGNEEREGKGDFFIYEHPEYIKVYVAITFEPGDFFRRIMLPFFESLFPHIMMTFITHKKLKKLLENFKEENQFSSIIITRASQRFRFNEEGKNKKIVPVVSWPQMDLSKAFQWVYENNGWFQSLKFKAKRHISTFAEISITRQGVLVTNNLFEKVFKGFIQPVCKIIHENIEFFGNRGRLSNRKLSAKPLTVDFGIEQFADVSENNKFIQSMKRLNKASVSVIHGNPYIHLSVVDYFDGSTFDLWVLNSSQLFIVPQMKATVSSIKRIINHVFDTYAEGDIRDYREALD